MKKNSILVGLVVALPIILQQSCVQLDKQPEKKELTPSYLATPLNDTGIGQTKYSSFQSDYYFKPENVKQFPGQDPQYGRDAASKNGLLGDSQNGFNFSKSGSCVLDEVTGLLWEVKKDASDSGLQSNKWTFTWGEETPDENVKLIYHAREPIVEGSEDSKKPEKPALKKHEDFVINSAVLFDFDQYNLTSAAKNILDETVLKFQDRMELIKTISVIGHTDSRGSHEYNQILSQHRAQTVSQYLENVEGLTDKTFQSIGRGEVEPLDSNLSDAGRANNRRVIIRLEFKLVAEEIPESDHNLDVVTNEGELVVKYKPIKTQLLKHDEVSQIGEKKPEFAVIAKCSDEKNKYKCTAIEYVAKINELELCGYSDWRLPNREELRSIVNYGQSMPSSVLDYFPNTISSAYWTSTPYVRNRFSMWVVNFEHGGDNTHEKHRAIPIRVVRSEQINRAHVKGLE